jgi:hypothetical protein
MSIAAMKQALEALEKSVATCFHEYTHEQVMSFPEHFINQTITALRAAIEQAEKPVAWRWKEVKGEFVGHWVLTVIEPPPYVTESMPLYTAPRQWVGLTDGEKRQIMLNDPIDWIAAIEAKLKEKNDVLRSV